MVNNHFRWDFIGLSTDVKPTADTSSKVTDGSTFYCSDNSKLYIWYKDQWYEKTVSGGGGGGTSYSAGDGIDITNNTISVDTETIQEKLTDGTGIDITNNTISVDTDTIQEKLTAGENISIINNVISAIGGGGSSMIRVLTADDYNYPVSNPTSVNPGMMGTGIYFIADGNVNVYNGSNALNNRENCIFIVSKTPASSDLDEMMIINSENGSGNNSYKIDFYYVNTTTGVTTPKGGALGHGVLDSSYVTDNLTSNSSKKVLSANMGRSLNQKLTPTTGTSAPTSATAGTIGKIYIDTTTETAYMCVASSGGEQTWKQITA